MQYRNIYFLLVSYCLFASLLTDVLGLGLKHCKKGFFKDKNGHCVPLLGCQTMKKDLQPVREINGGYVKSITHVRWKNIDLAHSVLRNPQFEDDFMLGMKLLEMLQESKFVAEVVGLCYDPMQILTKYYKYGSADNFSNLMRLKGYADKDEFQIRIKMTMSYLEIIKFLHHGGNKPRVMCDSNDLKKTLSQYLVTDDYELVLADLDAVPEINKTAKQKIKCGHRQLFGAFVAPEQLWPYEDQDFDDELMPSYDEKTDIWKIPDVVYFLLGNSPSADILKFRLFDILKQCKLYDSSKRPNVNEILDHFRIEVRKMVNQEHHTGEEL